MEMTREQFMELMGMEEGSDGLDYADELHEDGKDWFQIAKELIATMNAILLN